ncbi:U32 family peptidase [uncultured Cetobacterium sp.]|uniref:peptidase U32 family protein n=1 Tax=uncultured Cetobacterium sp. TaxID=527638 RepID=UPI0026100E76|nr:U32 family peptidase [uncultured Cetobacterium sp.]
MKIVAPAGSIERFHAAIKAGADEIYMGLKGFGARRNAVNLTLEEYKEALDYAHARGVKVFLTLNTIMMDVEIEAIAINLRELYKHGLDAVIVQDFGLAKFIKVNFPDLELHGSTQMTVANHIEANYLKSIGFERVVLPRELTFEEIKEIRQKSDIELEIFVSGALCISYSGNCYMSSFIGRRSGNRGMCAQPCRKKYTSNGDDEGYTLSPKDQLYGYDEIQKLKEIGIDSIKLEGRMKEPNYVFQTVNYYKELINGNNVEEKSSQIFNRGYSTGYFYKDRKDIMNKSFASHLGKNLGELNGKELKLKERIILGDGVTFLSKDYEKIGGTYINRIDTKFEKNKREANSGETLILKDLPKETKYVYRNYSKEISDLIESKMKTVDKKHAIDITFKGKIGEKAKITVSTLNNKFELIKVSLESENIIEQAKNKGTSQDIISEKLLEIGDTTFVGFVKNIEIDENIFLPISTLKQLKRDAVKILLEKLVLSYRKESCSELIKLSKIESSEKNSILSAIVSTKEQKNILNSYGVDKIYFKGYDVAREENLEKIDLSNKMATNLYQALENKNPQITLGWNLNISNRYAFDHFSNIEKIDTIIVSPEISYRRLEEMGETKIKKAILAYGRPRAMYTELSLGNEEVKVIENEQGDKFTIIKNDIGNSEIYLEKPLNILKDRKYLEKIGVSELVLEFTTETAEEIKDILDGKGRYRPYNYEKGVF